jgi:hypothetical protein
MQRETVPFGENAKLIREFGEKQSFNNFSVAKKRSLLILNSIQCGRKIMLIFLLKYGIKRNLWVMNMLR